MTTIWHNPRCTKSRQTLALLQDKGEELEVRVKAAEIAPSDMDQADISAKMARLLSDYLEKVDTAIDVVVDAARRQLHADADRLRTVPVRLLRRRRALVLRRGQRRDALREGAPAEGRGLHDLALGLRLRFGAT